MNRFKLSSLAELGKAVGDLNKRLRPDKKIIFRANDGPCLLGILNGAIQSSQDYYLAFVDNKNCFQHRIGGVYEFSDFCIVEIDEKQARLDDVNIYYSLTGAIAKRSESITNANALELACRKQSNTADLN